MSDRPTFAEHRYRSFCGRLDLYARIYPGDGPALLLMHGLTRNSADFEPLARHLAGRYRLIVPDQRGRGRSDWDDDAANYRPDIYAADMFALLDGLDVQSAGLVGTSMGGLMAMLMAMIQPQRFGAVVLNDIGPRVDPAGLARIQGYVGATPAFASWEAAALRCAEINGSAFPDFGPGDWMAFARRTCRENEDGGVTFAYDPAISAYSGNATTAPSDVWPIWDALAATPVLVVRGETSDVLSPEIVEEMKRRHAGPFHYVDVAGRGHAPILDEEAALRGLERFLAAHHR